ncbi:MAG: HAD hydrolase-like protein [Clostridia bacterium]|nr:HAD hydrolase-like protein [Clostridia bacterium]
MREYLICIDSDGCAIDSMDIKHKKCFGPCMIKEWGLEQWQDDILNRWNEINLYSSTRGINRFIALERILSEADKKYTAIHGLDAFSKWCREANALSNDELKKMVYTNQIFLKALSWSEAVNAKIEEISNEICPFKEVEAALKYIHQKADVAIVSSANPKAVDDEWTRFGLMKYVDFVMAQDKGSKKECITKLLAMGYKKEKTLMIGDALGDEKAAKSNNISFYPIVTGKENESWKAFYTEVFDAFAEGRFPVEYQEKVLAEFHNAFGI